MIITCKAQMYSLLVINLAFHQLLTLINNDELNNK